MLAQLALTNKLDENISDVLITLGAPLNFDEAIYKHTYRLVNHYAERALQIELVIATLSNVHRLGRKRLLGVALQSTRPSPTPSAWAISIASCGWVTRRFSRCVTSHAF